MAAPATTEEFIDLVRKSGVVDEKRLDAFVQQMRSSGSTPDNAGKLAGLMVQEGLLTHFQAEQIMLGKWRRFTIGKYKVLERLGSGGMGSVYLCEHKFMRRRVAVKVLPAAKAEDQASLERFYREARAAAALDHPNIVRAYDIDQDENLHFLVMEYVDGASLQEIVKKFGPLPILHACHYVRQSAIGLQHAHEAGLVHRDIKPGNLLVDRTGTLKVLDMGLARFFHDEEDILTKKYDESVLGTADYLAPEQALDSHSVDIRADIYSLGATCYFCLVGNPPFNEGTVAQKLIWHQTRQPKPIRAVRPEVPEQLAVIIDRMMTKDRAKRFQTPGQVVDALAAWTAKAIAAPPDAWMPRLSPAAMGGMPEPTSVSAATPSPGGMPAAQPRPAQATPAPARPSSTPTATPRPVANTRQPVAAPPRPVAQQRPAPQGNGAFAQAPSVPPDWGEVAASGPQASVRRPTPPQTAKTTSSLRLPPAATAKGARLLASIKARPKLWLIGAGVVAGLVFLLFLTIVIFAMTRGGPRGTGAPPAGRTVTISAAPGKGEYRSVKEALAAAAQGDRLVVLDETIEEPLTLGMQKIAPNITLEGDPALGKRVIWRPPPPVKEGQQSTQLISLSNCEGLTLRNFDLLASNSSHTTRDLLVVFGRCPGLKLEELHIQGYRVSAVKLINCTGESGRPITLRNVHFSHPGDANAAALILEVGSNSTLTSMQHITVTDCLFEGPGRAGVQLAIGASCDLGSVEFVGNRFFKLTDGLWYRRPGGKPYPPLSFTVDSNTFVDGDRSAFFETMPLEGPRSRVVFKNNLFVRPKAMVQANDFNQAAADKTFSAEANVRDAAAKENNVNLKAVVVDCNALVTDPANRKQFLRYPKSSPLATAGQNKGPVGAPPVD